jgi:cyclopropane fatty-acyl-phospholipid synthase-like methyltransferase
MATRQEMEATYNFMDEIFRLSLGETGDLTCAMYNGDFSKTLAQAQRETCTPRWKTFRPVLPCLADRGW